MERTLDNYTLTHRLGVGGMGEVWKGRREAIGGAAVDVAIKVLSPQRASDPEARRMFLDEARLSLRLNNSNIVNVFDVAETADGTCYMVMEWVDGLNLTQLTNKIRKAGDRLPDPIIAYIIGELLKGLAHAHALRDPDTGQILTIVHRDVSPHNVMLSVHGEVKIMDFGVARIASEDTSGVHVKGKLRYMPPEQLQGETREPTLDLFSVGAILHELLDGVKFRSVKVDEGRMFGMIFAGEIPPMKRDPATIPPELEQLRASLLQPKAADRIQSAREAFRQLSRWSGYRDARFELDELVRHYVSDGDHVKTVVEPPPQQPEDDATSVYDSGQSTRHQIGAAMDAAAAAAGAAPAIAPPQAQGSFPGAPTTTEGGTVVMMPSEGSSTDVSDRLDSRTGQVPVADASSGGPPKALAAVVGIAFLCFVGLGVAAATGAFGDDEPDAEPDTDQVASAEPEPKPEIEPPAPTPEQAAEPAPAPEPAPAVEDSPVLEDEPILEDEPEDEPILEDEPEDEPGQESTPVARVKVSIKLGGGLPWAEFKLGGRSFELDAFSHKTGSARLAPGRYRASYRTTIDGAWKKAGRVTIPDHSATVTLSKGGQISVD